jgi:adenosyl cobinamide kinase/adenosyl cobinamide phosphate guanylyltransferase
VVQTAEKSPSPQEKRAGTGAVWVVTGAAGAEKSRFAQRLAESAGRAVIYLAALEPLEPDALERVGRETDGDREATSEGRARSPEQPEWRAVDAHRDVLTSLHVLEPDACVILDCFWLWASERLRAASGLRPTTEGFASLEVDLELALEALLVAVAERAAETIIVTEEREAEADGSFAGELAPGAATATTGSPALARLNARLLERAARAWRVEDGGGVELALAPEAGRRRDGRGNGKELRL